MLKAIHPADQRNAEIIAGAVGFKISIFLGRGQYANAEATSLAEAVAEADRLRQRHRNGRRPLIYAIDAAGRSAIVDHTQQVAKDANMEPKTYSKKFNAQRAAKAAGLKPNEFEIVKREGGFAFEPSKSAPAKAKNIDGRKPPRRLLPPRSEVEANARNGVLPPPPDFSAATHARFRGKLARLIELAEAGDIEGLKAIDINPVSTSPKAMKRYRDLCVIALEANKANS